MSLRASDLLRIAPNLPATSKGVLQGIVERMNDPEIHVPGLPPLPPIVGDIPPIVRDAVVAFLGKFDIEFYQTVGVRLTSAGVAVGGMGAKLTETLNVKNPTPNIKIIPVFELGASQKD